MSLEKNKLDKVYLNSSNKVKIIILKNISNTNMNSLIYLKKRIQVKEVFDNLIKNAEIVLIKRLGEVYYMKYDVAIKKLREKMIVSQEELSEILGVSLITVNRWENGKYEPTIRLKRKLNDLFLKYLLIEYNSTLEEKK